MATAAVQLRLALAPVCEWHEQPSAVARGVAPCARDGQVIVTDPVRGRRAVCCAAHGLTLVALWRDTVPNRRRNVTRVTVAWLPGVSRRVTLAPVIGGRRRPTGARAAAFGLRRELTRLAVAA